jgi:hypothetical protein
VRVVRINSRITEASNSAKERVIRDFVEEKSKGRDMRCGKRDRVDNEYHTLKHMILIVQGNEGIRNNRKAKFQDMTMFSLDNPILLRDVSCMGKRLDVGFETKIKEVA